MEEDIQTLSQEQNQVEIIDIQQNLEENKEIEIQIEQPQVQVQQQVEKIVEEVKQQIEEEVKQQIEEEVKEEQIVPEDLIQERSDMFKTYQNMQSILIDQNFKPNYQNKTSQEDFVKQFRTFDNDQLVIGTTENIKLLAYKFQGQSLEQVQSIQLSNPIYDTAFHQCSSHNKFLFVSQKDYPLILYKINENLDENQSFLTKDGDLSDIRKDTEEFQVPLTMRYSEGLSGLVGGGRRFIKLYDLEKLKVKTEYKGVKKTDIISTLDVPVKGSPGFRMNQSLIAYGKFDKTVQIIHIHQNQCVTNLKCHLGGVTHVQFDPSDSNLLYTGARKDNLIYQWDLRKPETFVNFYERPCNSNQRMNFDISKNGNFLLMGQENGNIVVQKLKKGGTNNQQDEQLVIEKAHQDNVNCVQFIRLNINNQLKYGFLSSSGQRQFDIYTGFPKVKQLATGQKTIEDDSSEWSDSDNEQQQQNTTRKFFNENSLKLWSLD